MHVDEKSHSDLLGKSLSYLLGQAEGKIMRLEGDNKALRAALRRIADLIDSEDGEPLDDAIRIAERALSATERGA